MLYLRPNNNITFYHDTLMQEKIIILDFGSQYTQLIARRIREINVYCEIHPFNKVPALTPEIKGVILSGSPSSVREEGAPTPDLTHIKGKLPLLGICYGAQHLSHNFGGEVAPSASREYGRANLRYADNSCPLLQNVTQHSQVWMSHGDTIVKLPNNYKITASTDEVKVAAFQVANEQTYGLQFHPEVYHSTEGHQILKNFVCNICGCEQNWTPDSFVDTTVKSLQEKLGNDKVVLGLSGGVDSSVAALLLHRAIGKNLTCIFVDNGLLRKDEFTGVLDSYQHMGLNVIGVDARDRFLSELKGKTDPEEKRKTIGRVFIEVFDVEAHKIQDVKWLAQGTIYPDIIESVSVNGPSVTIKSHHNVGGLPEKMHLKVVEPLNLLFKDEVRRVGRSLNLEETILNRHPFPGPGLAIRILGEITPERVALLQEVDHIFINGLKTSGLYDSVWQAGVILLPVQTVGVMGDERTYENAVALRAVSSTDGMTADWVHLPYEFLANISNEIINKVRGVNRVVYDISSKPPATIEWE
ncbi:GMP synthase (glutamine-hydrolysing) [Breznakibacter xylanolyticus]|uniref:GMP synthase [glutamine-hydrolyzing] n=2 Tax=Breznakibacter xylanolyticus TaxID=990 RepID=A0A2W7NEK5_9BACT|nr:GMP synthase (glutamine-hydrolysing) [Breznakibacter xylanolyticus]